MSIRPFRVLAALGFAALAASAQAEVFINEIHYDNVGADAGERIEIAATAGESLSGWRVHLYNGSGATTAAVAYDNDPVPTGTLSTCGGLTVRFATVSYPANGLQNGTHDGIALVNPSGSVVQFVSYKGQIRGGSGAASGRTSVNLAVAESDATAIGHSLQLGGTASGSAGFAWQSAQSSTFGSCNRNQAFPAPPPTGYYSRVNTSSASQLRCSLHAIIKGHTAYPYSASTIDSWDILEIADEDPANTARILDVYRNRSYAKVSDRAGTGTGITYNREHVWPNSLGFGSQTGNLGLPYAPYTDTHMLYLSDTAYNSDRGNKPYANCPASSGCGERATEVNNGTGGGAGVYPGSSNWVKGPDGNAGSFEVFNARKGDVARAILYMAIRYEGGTHPTTGQGEPDLELTDDRSKIVITSGSPAYMGLMSTLLQWHQFDPPNAAERIRNEAIQEFQGNRNPFIDHPEWATQALFTSVKPASCQLN